MSYIYYIHVYMCVDVYTDAAACMDEYRRRFTSHPFCTLVKIFLNYTVVLGRTSYDGVLREF